MNKYFILIQITNAEYKKIAAIKFLRSFTGMSLVAGKEAVEKHGGNPFKMLVTAEQLGNLVAKQHELNMETDPFASGIGVYVISIKPFQEPVYVDAT